MLPDEMEGGPENPLGARALYIGGKIYRIHGTNAPGSIGGAVSSGCIRMMNTDVIDLYDRVKIGAKVYVYAVEACACSLNSEGPHHGAALSFCALKRTDPGGECRPGSSPEVSED